MHREKKEEKKKRKMTTEKTVPLFFVSLCGTGVNIARK